MILCARTANIVSTTEHKSLWRPPPSSSSSFSFEPKEGSPVAVEVADWANPLIRRDFFDQYAHHKGFDPLVADNWYMQPTASIKSKVTHMHPLRALPQLRPSFHALILAPLSVLHLLAFPRLRLNSNSTRTTRRRPMD